jgi:hypothetical protein
MSKKSQTQNKGAQKHFRKGTRYTDVAVSELEATPEDQQNDLKEPNGTVPARAPRRAPTQNDKNEIDTEPTVDDLVLQAASAFTNIMHARQR